MSESGGPANQSGIYYQNTIAALHFGRMLDLRPRDARFRIVDVRLEAPTAVDDIVVRFADGAHHYIQAKQRLTTSDSTWRRLWECLARQRAALVADSGDRLILWLGEYSALAEDLRECAKRTTSAVDDAEYVGRLTASQKQTFEAITGAFDDAHDCTSIRSLLSRLDVEIMAESSIERDHVPNWMPEGVAGQTGLLGVLRDLAGGVARVRGSYDAHTLRERLKRDHGIELPEPDNWGAAIYRDVLRGKAVIQVPGTSFVKPVSEGFLWPRASRYDRTRRADFDDEAAFSSIGIRSSDVDLTLFPGPGLDRVIVVAGPGFGKSALLLALAARGIEHGRLPVIVSVPELASAGLGVVPYLQQRVNAEFSVSIDWEAAADAGLLQILFDGLDEISGDRRKAILDKIATFSLRYPTTPWLLTVRDAAALAAPAGAALVELQPLDNNDLHTFITRYRSEQLADRLIRRLHARPDLQRLVRIPLLLAILLTTSHDVTKLPSNRRELLESYVEIMLHAEHHKPSEDDDIDAAILRPIVEKAAFDALEREEIGVRPSVLEATVRKHTPTGGKIQPVVEKLVKCGLLRRTSPTRFEFSFPIVQEYLAACHILNERIDEIGDRLASIHKRPWAQALQFVLEGHPSPHRLAAELLQREDDAFDTNLRLIARCVANGMRIAPAEHIAVARRLAARWTSSTWRTSAQIGDLLAEAFYKPLVPELRALLSNYDLLHAGAGAIVNRIGDPVLTRAVLTELLEGDVKLLLNLGELQEPINRIADDALAIYAERSRRPGSKEFERNAMATLIAHLDRTRVSEAARLAVALDARLPVPVRLAAFLLGPSPIDDRARPLIAESLTVDDFDHQAAAVAALATMPDAIERLRAAIRSVQAEPETATDLADHAATALPASQLRAAFGALASDELLSDGLRCHFLVFAARYGDAAAMMTLIERFDTLPIDLVEVTLANLGHHRTASFVKAALARLGRRALSPFDRVEIAGGAALGMTSRFEMTRFNNGNIRPTSPHPGLSMFRSFMEAWGTMTDYTPEQALRLDDALASLGSKLALARLSGRIETVLNAADYDTSYANDIEQALRGMRDRYAAPDLVLLEKIARGGAPIDAASAVQMIGTLGTRDALDTLFAIHNATHDSGLKHVALDAMETLSARLGLRVRRVDDRLELASN